MPVVLHCLWGGICCWGGNRASTCASIALVLMAPALVARALSVGMTAVRTKGSTGRGFVSSAGGSNCAPIMDEQVVLDFSGPFELEVSEVPQVAAALPPTSSVPPAVSIFSMPSFATHPVPSGYVFEPLPVVVKPTVPLAAAVGPVAAAVNAAAELPRPCPVVVPSTGSSSTSHDQTVP